MKLAVYGTLRSFHGNNALLGSDAKLITETRLPGFSLYNLGWFPGVVPDPDGPGVVVEVYEINPERINSLDAYEGYRAGNAEGSLFVRNTVNVDGVDGDVMIYHYNHPMTRGELVADGDWKNVNVERAG